MPLFKRREQNLIPPVEQPPYGNRGSDAASQRPPTYRSSANTYNASRDGDPYNDTRSTYSYHAPPPMGRSNSSGTGMNREPVPPPSNDGFSRRSAPVDPYSRGERDLDADRNALFGGANAQRSGSSRFVDGPAGRRTPPPGEEEEEDVEGIKTQSRFVKQESVNSTRNALRMAREAEETARNTLLRLGDQSEKIANTERHLDVAKGHSNRAEDNANEIKKLNRSIFIPVVTFNKDQKRQAEEQKRLARHEEERDEREGAMRDIRETQNRVGRAATYGRTAEDEEEGIAAPGGNGGYGRRTKTATEQNLRKEQRKRFQFEATASDDEMEDELDDNLDEISDMTKRLKALGTAMGQELDEQNTRLGRIEGKTTKLDTKLVSNTDKLKRIR